MVAFTPEKLGPGELKIGATGTEIDVSCQATAAHIDWDENADDDTTVLCGDTVPGARTYSAHFVGTLFQDTAAAESIVRFSWDNKGTSQPFTFTPSTDDGTSATGNLIIGPLTFGGDAAGDNMTSDFDWAIVGDPVLSAATP